jgi:hypothetical protein
MKIYGSILKRFFLFNNIVFLSLDLPCMMVTNPKIGFVMVLRQNVASHNVYVTKRNITKRQSF